MTSDRFRRLVSAAVAIWRSSQVIGASKTAAHSAVARPSSSLGLEWMDISSTLLVGVGEAGRHVAAEEWWSSCNSRRAGWRIPDGWRESASLVWFLTPGMYTIRNR